MFTSNLSVNEFVLLGIERAVPLGQVMGNSIYRFDLDMATQRLGTGEIKPLLDPLMEVYQHALSRLQQGAQRLGAEAVVGVRLEETRRFPTLLRPQNALTVKAIGTAVALDTSERSEKPALLSVSGQDYYVLRRAGLRPIGFVFGQSVYYQLSQSRVLFADVPRSVSLMDFQRINGNIERTDYTEAITKARRLAVRRMEEEAEHRHAEGIIDIVVTIRPCLVETGLLIECLTHGTAVVTQGQLSETVASCVACGSPSFAVT